ncbi:MAG: TonB-dependent receptor domain-containing protein, partial [Terracidiphilus sp.]
ANNNQMLFSEARGRASGSPYVYSVDSIKEFQAETSNYSVEFGQAAGGQVNAITKSGTNQFHGDLFYLLRYPSLNALDPYTKYNARFNQPNPTIAAFLLTQPTHQQQQFGGSGGGPLRKDKLFYFFTYDGFRKVGKALYTDSNYLSTLPSATNPPPTGTSPSNTITPTQCPNTITPTQCLAGIQFLIDESTAAPSRFQKEDLFFPRVDYHINAKNDAFLDFNFANYQSAYGYSGGVTFNNSSPSTNGPTYYHERFLVGGWTTQIGTASVNEVHGQWGRDLETAGAYASGPSVSMGVDTFGMPNALPRAAEPDEHRIQISDVFSTTHRRQTWKFGGDINVIHEVMINLFQGGGLYSYGESTNLLDFQDWIQDAFAGQPGDTDPYAGYRYKTLIETVDQVNKTAGTQGKDDFWMKMFDGFAEDSWKLTPKITITAGVRYDIQLTPNPGLVNHLFDPISSEYTSSIKNVTDRVQPRIAFSWLPFNHTVVRGGYGLFSALNQGSTYYAMRVENGVVQLNYTFAGCYSSKTGDSPTPPNSVCPTPPASGSRLSYPNLPYQPSGPALSQALYPAGGTAPTVNLPSSSAVSYSFHGLDPNFVPPLAHEMNLSVEQSLPAQLSLQVGYVGTRGMRLPVFVDSNLIGQTPHGLATYLVQDASNNVTKTLTVPVYLPSDRRNTSLSSFNTGFSVANTWYNAMAVTVRRPFTNGLEVLGNYTWAHATDTGQVQGSSGTFYGGDTPSDPNNIRFDNGPSDIDIRNRGTLSFVYQPTFSVGNPWMKTLVDGFQFSGAEIASGGEPVFLGVS